MGRRDATRWLVAAALLPWTGLFEIPGTLAASPPDPASAVAACRRESDTSAVVTACSIVISLSKDRVMLERAYDRRGLAYERLHRFDEAAQDFTELIRINPGIAGYFDNRLRVYKAAGRLDDALKDGDTAVRLAPTYAFTYHGRGAVLVDMGRYDAAIRDFDSALAINANDAPLLVDRGRAYEKSGQYRRAIVDFSAATVVDATFMSALRERGLAEKALGDQDAARADLLAAQAGGLNDDDMTAALADLAPRPADVPPPAGADTQALADARAARTRSEATIADLERRILAQQAETDRRVADDAQARVALEAKLDEVTAATRTARAEAAARSADLARRTSSATEAAPGTGETRPATSDTAGDWQAAASARPPMLSR